MAGDAGDLQFRIRHTMLPVASLERSLAFYTGLLGMKVVRERQTGPGSRSVAYVGYGDEGSNHMLELIENSEAASMEWSGHVAIAVSNLTVLVSNLKRHNVAFSRPMTKSVGGTNKYVCFVVDPDGYEIELNERLNGIDS